MKLFGVDDRIAVSVKRVLYRFFMQTRGKKASLGGFFTHGFIEPPIRLLRQVLWGLLQFRMLPDRRH